MHERAADAQADAAAAAERERLADVVVEGEKLGESSADTNGPAADAEG